MITRNKNEGGEERRIIVEEEMRGSWRDSGG
jgi:hypothetical protein